MVAAGLVGVAPGCVVVAAGLVGVARGCVGVTGGWVEISVTISVRVDSAKASPFGAVTAHRTTPTASLEPCTCRILVVAVLSMITERSSVVST